MVRGYNEQVFYFETQEKTDRIIQLEFDPQIKNQIKKKEVWQLSGSRVMTFELDAENINDDLTDKVQQSLYVMDDSQKIYLLKNNESSQFVITKTIDLSHHDILQDVKALQNNDWVRLNITDRALTLSNRTYNFANNQSIEVKVPKAYFGQEN